MKTQLTVFAVIVLIGLGCNTTKMSNDNLKPDTSMTSATISGTTWELTKLEGAMVDQSATKENKIHFILNSTDHTVSGYAGCNTFGGTYTLEKGNRIRFNQMLSTLRACPDVDVNESEFLKVFELADNYTINGDLLMLNVGKRAPLAVFEAVYF